MDYGKALSNGFYFAAKPKKLGALFTIYLLYAVLLLIPVAMIASALPLLSAAPTPANALKGMGMMFSGIIFFGLLVLVIALLDFWVRGAFIHNAGEYAHGRKDASVMASFSAAVKRYLKFFVATIIVGIISGIICWVFAAFAVIPLIGILFAFLEIIAAMVLALVFLFVPYSAILSGKGVAEVVKESYEIFRENPGSTFAVALLTMIISLAIVLVALIPAAITALALFTSAASAATPQLMLALAMQTLFTPGYAAAVAVSVIIGVLGMAFSHLFAYGSYATAYLEVGGTKAVARKPAKRRPARKARKRK